MKAAKLKEIILHSVKSQIKSRIKLTAEWYNRYTNYRNISWIMMKGLDFEMDEKTQEVKLDSKLFHRLAITTFLMSLAMFRMISSYLFYEQSWSLVVLGNHFPATQMPKFIAVSSIFVAASTNCIVRIIFASKVLSRDRDLQFHLKLVSIIAGSDSKLEKGMDQQIVLEVRQSLRPVICFMKLTSATSIPGTMYLFQLAAFWYLSEFESFWTLQTVIKLLWSIHYVVWMMNGFWMLHAVSLIVIIQCKLPILMIKNVIASKNGDEETSADCIMEKLKLISVILNNIRKRNSFMKWILGYNIADAYYNLIMFTFAIITSSNVPMSIRACHVLYEITVFGIFALFVLAVAKLTTELKEIIECTSASVPFHKIGMKSRYRILRALEMCRVNQSFSCFSYIPTIDYAFFLEVRYAASFSSYNLINLY